MLLQALSPERRPALPPVLPSNSPNPPPASLSPPPHVPSSGLFIPQALNLFQVANTLEERREGPEQGDGPASVVPPEAHRSLHLISHGYRAAARLRRPPPTHAGCWKSCMCRFAAPAAMTERVHTAKTTQRACTPAEAPSEGQSMILRRPKTDRGSGPAPSSHARPCSLALKITAARAPAGRGTNPRGPAVRSGPGSVGAEGLIPFRLVGGGVTLGSGPRGTLSLRVRSDPVGHSGFPEQEAKLCTVPRRVKDRSGAAMFGRASTSGGPAIRTSEQSGSAAATSRVCSETKEGLLF